MHILYGKATFPYKICEKNRPTRYGVHRTWITGEVLPQLCTLQKIYSYGRVAPPPKKKSSHILYGKATFPYKICEKNRPSNLGSPIPSDTGEVPPQLCTLQKYIVIGGSTPPKNFSHILYGISDIPI
jgi:hypothetical protein